ncbi:MAG TPA: glycogen debranching N-terminal domain-containing protein [Micromonosporaceae bacterium]
MPEHQISILKGSAFVVSDRLGDVSNALGNPNGLFYRDMRHLSQWQLRLNGRRLDVLSARTLEYDEAVFFLIEPTGTIYRNPAMSLIRRREVADGMREHLELHNHGLHPVDVEISLLFDADFADLFEVKDNLTKKGELYRQREHHGVTLGYLREDFRRETYIHARDAYFTHESLTFRVTLAPRESWSATVVVTVGTSRDEPLPQRIHRPEMPETLEGWLANAPTLDTDWQDLRQVYRRSLIDLAALRFYPESVPDSSLPAAGLPWFMALFGRDSLLTSYQAMPFVPELARTTLLALGAQQAREFDDFRDAEPGKILHELRHGELAHFGERPHSPYFGSVDATPLFLIVLDEYERWTGDTDTVRQLEGAARAALEWIERYGDIDGDGYLEYATRNPRTGLENQCWKDSWNSIVHPDGRLATLPRACCEIQGYAYDARVRMARLAREVWQDADLAARLEADAAQLKAQFDRDFWLPEEGFYALALDGDKKPVPTLASNIGHLLWSGIVRDERVEAVVAHLGGERMFSGWGVRTLADGQPVYNPIEYHNGTVWPHDTSLIAAGLARYGRRQEANRLVVALMEAASHFSFRLPEAFAGYARADTGVPVEYPTACSPQAWAAGAPLLLLRLMLGLEPTAHGLTVRPHLPAGVRRLILHGLPGRWGYTEAAAVRD